MAMPKPEPGERSAAEVLEDHLRCRAEGDVEGDLARNYAANVVVFTARGRFDGHDGVRRLSRMLNAHVPHDFEFPIKLAGGRFAYIEWRARRPGLSVEDGADSFVIEQGRIVFQSIHYSVIETMPGGP